MKLKVMKNQAVPACHPIATLNPDALIRAFAKLNGDSLGTINRVLVSNGQYTSVPQQKEETMYTETQTQRLHLSRRLDQISWAKDREMLSAFHMNGNRPKSFKEAADRLKAGDYKIELDDEDVDNDYFDTYDFAALINWQTEEPDKEGYKAASEEMKKAKTEAEDAIAILDPKDGLEALKAFEAKTFH